MAANSGVVKQSHLKNLQQHVQSLLSEQEKHYFSYALKDYRTYKSVEKLVRSLITCLNTSAKFQLFKDVRNLVLPSQVGKYDTLIAQISIGNVDQPSRSPREGSSYTNGGPKLSNHAKYRVISLINDKVNNTDLGFTICGGKEFGIPIYVCKVMRNLPAYNSGLLENDQLIEVNGISLENISLSSAGNLLLSLNKLKLVVREEKHTDIFSAMTELNPWAKAIDAAFQNGSTRTYIDADKLSTSDHGPSSLHSSFNDSPEERAMMLERLNEPASVAIRRNSSILNADNANDERRINLMVESNDDNFIGFNIRGGSEYGLGIYVSRVDDGSFAEKCGIKVGDQILDANGTSFDNILHKDAVNFLKSNKNIILTVKAVGRIPEERCFFEEYSWLAADGSIITSARKSEYLSSSMPLNQSRDLRDFATDATELPWNQTINLPPGAFIVERELGEESNTVNSHAKGVSVEVQSDRIEDTTSVAKDIEIVEDEECKVRRSPSSTSLVSKKSSDSGKSAGGTKSSVNSGDFSDSDRSREDLSNLLSVSKAKRSKSFLQKQGNKLKAKFSFRAKKKSAKPSLFDSELFGKSSTTREWLQYIDGISKERLVVNDYNALMKHIKHYLEKGDIELFTSNVLEILDTQGKALLLKDIRTIVFPYDIGRFDARIAKREMDNMIALGRDPIESPILDVQLSEKPPKKTLVTAVQDTSGKFQLKSKTEAERLEKEKEENTRRSKKYIQQRSLLERESTTQRFKSSGNVPRPSREHTQSWGHDPDDEEDKELDYIPTKDVPNDVEDLYAKVDKSKKNTMNERDEVAELAQRIPSIKVEGEKKLTRSLTAMSDINEDMEYAVLDIQFKDTQANSNNSNGNAVSDAKATQKEETPIAVSIQKNSKTLGISISGGKGSSQQPEIRIEQVLPGGAVAEAGVLKAGYQILSIDEESLQDATHNEAVDMIRRSFNSKSKATMDIVATAS